MSRWRRSPGLALLVGGILLLLAGCDDGSPTVAPVTGASPELTLLALGDSYTVGHSLPAAWSWPRQLADSLAAGGDTLAAVTVVARTGWTTRDLLDAVRARSEEVGPAERPFGLVTLMIGVNNQFQGLDVGAFAAELDTLAALAVDLAGNDPRRVLGFTIPDYGVTPVGRYYDPERISDEIAALNAVVHRTCSAWDIDVVDITPLSLAAAAEPRLVSRDGLHYSREMYARWVGLMLPAARTALGLDAPRPTAAAPGLPH